MVKTIDVHTHLYPKPWMDYLEKANGPVIMKRTGPTSAVFYVRGGGVSAITMPGHYDLDSRMEDFDKCGIDIQILSLTTPGVEFLPDKDGVEWARRINDYFADVRTRYPGRYFAHASLPYQDIDAALEELDRSYKQLGIKGITMFSNIDGKPIASPEFFPIYKKAEEYGLPVFIHPGYPLIGEILEKQKINKDLYGFAVDTSMAVLSLIWQGILEKYPGLNIVHPHLGGIIPYMTHRMEACWKRQHEKLGLELPMAPSEYYKRQVYPDSNPCNSAQMRCCLDYVGPEHICLGTDYAHSTGEWETAIKYIKDLGLSEKDTNNILGGNAAIIYKIEEP